MQRGTLICGPGKEFYTDRDRHARVGVRAVPSAATSYSLTRLITSAHPDWRAVLSQIVALYQPSLPIYDLLFKAPTDMLDCVVAHLAWCKAQIAWLRFRTQGRLW
jgi:hypothetical protein